MKTSIWYDMEEGCPPQTGYYLAFKGMSMGNDDTRCSYYYWDARRAEWRENEISNAYRANVIYWTEADPADWYEHYSIRPRSEVSVAEKDALEAVKQAIERYEMVRALTKV